MEMTQEQEVQSENVSPIINQLDAKEFYKLAEKLLTPKKARLAVRTDYDLRGSLQEKMYYARDVAPMGWLVLINSAGTLAHVVHGDKELNLRVPMKSNVKGFSKHIIEKMMIQRLEDTLVM